MRRTRLTALACALALICSGTALIAVPGAGASTATRPLPTRADETAGRGAASLGSTDYPIPDGALFVATTGADTDAGTVDAPFATLAHALAVATPGATIVLRGGTYHESVASQATTPVTVQNYPGEEVWFDGSVPVDDWTPSGTTWVHDGWTAQFSSLPGYDPTSAESDPWINPAYPMAAHPDELFVDGVQLAQVADAAHVVAGTFAVDYTTQQLIMGSDPTGHEVRAADLSTAIDLMAPGSVLRGIGVRRYATAVPDRGAVRLYGGKQTLQDVVVTDIATYGVQLSGKNQVIDHVTVNNNGLGGLHGNVVDGVRITRSIFTNNNTERFNCSPVAAGVKLARTDNATIDDNLFADNYSIGMWFDVSSYGMTIKNNDMLRNFRSGISLELSGGGLVVNNTSADNKFDGIRVFDAGTMRIWNNTLSNNAVRNLDLAQDTRVMTASNPARDKRRPFPDPTLDWQVKKMVVRNNILLGDVGFDGYYQDQTSKSASSRGVDIDHNLFGAPPTTRTSPFGIQIGPTTVITRKTLKTWLTYSGHGKDNVLAAGSTLPTMTADLANTTHAVPLPSDIATATGLPSGQLAWGRT